MVHRSRFGRALAAVAAFAVAAVAAPPLAHAQDSPPTGKQTQSIPGVASLPDVAQKVGDGTINAESFKHLDLSQVDGMNLPPNFTREGPADVPDHEASTNPRCAPLVMVAVPGTFEIHRGHDPNEPIGLLGKVAQPLRDTGSLFSETYINYDADAGINGVSYANSVGRGTEKTLATIEDVSKRCKGSRVLLSGYSQGADIAGDAATAIGQGQTAIPREAIAGVVLFADPQRTENTNVLSGSSSELPKMPGELGDAMDKMLSDPSLAQTQMSVNQVSGIAQQLLGGGKDGESKAGAEKSGTSTSSTNRSKSPTSKPSGSHSPSSSTSTPEQAGKETRPSETATAAPAKVSGDTIGPVAMVLAAEGDNASKVGEKQGEQAGQASKEKEEGGKTLSDNPIDVLYAHGVFPDLTLAGYKENCDDDEAKELLRQVKKDKHKNRSTEDLAHAYTKCLGKNDKGFNHVGEQFNSANEKDVEIILSAVDKCTDDTADVCRFKINPDLDLEATNESAPDGVNKVVIPGQLGDNPSPAFVVEVPQDKVKDTKLADGHAWATDRNVKQAESFNKAYASVAKDNKIEPNAEAAAEPLDSVKVQEKVSDLYRSGGCGALSFEQCVKRYDVDYAHGPLNVLSKAQEGKEAPEQLKNVPKGNLMETGCVSKPAGECAAANTKSEGSSLPKATSKPKIDGEKKPNSKEPQPAEGNEPSVSTSSEKPESKTSAPSSTAKASDKSEPSDTYNAAAGAEKSPTSSSTSAEAGDETRPSASANETAGAETSAKSTSTKTSKSSSVSSSTAEQAGKGTSPKSTSSTAKSKEAKAADGKDKNGKGKDGDSANAKKAEGEPVEGVAPVTMKAVAGGGIAGARETDFGTLTGAVVSLCVPGDVVCSLPENSELATKLVGIGEKMTVGEGGLATTAKSLAAGDTRMAGLLTVQAVDTLAQISGLPPTKLSPQTIEMLIALATGGSMVAMGDPTGAGAALLATTIPQIATALPEIFAQLQDIPAIIEALPQAGDTAARNLGLEKVSAKLAEGFGGAGMTDISSLANIPTAVMDASAALLEDNSGLMELATNPDYLKAGAHGEPGFRSIKISDTEDGIIWTQGWMDAIRKAIA